MGTQIQLGINQLKTKKINKGVVGDATEKANIFYSQFRFGLGTRHALNSLGWFTLAEFGGLLRSNWIGDRKGYVVNETLLRSVEPAFFLRVTIGK